MLFYGLQQITELWVGADRYIAVTVGCQCKPDRQAFTRQDMLDYIGPFHYHNYFGVADYFGQFSSPLVLLMKQCEQRLAPRQPKRDAA